MIDGLSDHSFLIFIGVSLANFEKQMKLSKHANRTECCTYKGAGEQRVNELGPMCVRNPMVPF